MGTPQVALQMMVPKVSEAEATPVVGLLLETLTIVEGSSTLVKVKRTVVASGACSVQWLVDAPGGLLASPASGRAAFTTGVTEVAFTVATNPQVGAQGDRTITVRLEDAQGCVINPAQQMGSIMVRDQVAPGLGWWELAKRSGRPWASGVAYAQGAATAELSQAMTKREQEVALIDAASAWTVDPEGLAAVVPPSVQAVDDQYTLTVGTGSEDLDVLLNDTVLGGRKQIGAVTPTGPNLPMIAASELSVVGTIPAQKVRVRKDSLQPTRKYNFSYRLMVENEAGVFGDANVELTMQAVAPPPVGGRHFIAYPKPPREVVLSTNGTALQNGAALLDAYNALQPGSVLYIPAVTYDTSVAAGFTFGRTTGINQSNPIVIRVKDDKFAQAEFKKRIRITAPDHTIIGFFCSSGDGSGATGGGNALFGISGARSRFSRCRAWQQAKVGRACFIISANDVIVDFYEAWNPFGGQGTIDGRGICLEPTTLPKNWKMIRGYVHNFDQNKYNFHEPIQAGRGGKTWDYHCNGLILENRISDCTNEGESISIKSAGNEMTGNCLINGGGQSRFTNRFGENNRWYANISKNADGFNDRGFGTLYHSNLVQDGGTMELNAGEFTKAQWMANSAAGGFPASTDALCYYNNCDLRLGPVFGGSNANKVPCAHPTVRAHTGPVVDVNSVNKDVKVGDPPPASAEAKITPRMLAVSDVGPVSNEGPV